MGDTRDIQLGAFRLRGPLGSGGQGTVWAAEHVDTGIRAAVKILTEDRARKPRALRAFHREVRAAARLDHPNTIVILDQGEVPLAASTQSPEFIPGSPYLVMERAFCSLARLPRPFAWDAAKVLLKAVLAGLSHAHSRGVLHRDVKPGNILFPHKPETAEDYASACLADFGLAVDRTSGVPLDGIATAGSPGFMAPEQFTGDSAEIGVETDLYAVGWLGWWLVSTELPFHNDDIRSIRKKKISGRLPPWPSDTPAPPGFREWVLKLLDTDPLRRFSSAAAASHALDVLRGSAGGLQVQPAPAEVTSGSQPTIDFLTLDQPDSSHSVWSPHSFTRDHSGATTEVAPNPPHHESLGAVADRGLPALELLPLPREAHAPPAAEKWNLRGTGLALLGLRSPRPIGRDEVLNTLWSDLVAASDFATPRHVLLHGPVGVGRSTVLRELAQSAYLSGAVSVLEVRASDGPRGMSQALARFFGVVGLHPVDQERRLSRRLRQLGIIDPVDLAAVIRLVRSLDSAHLVRPADAMAAFHTTLEGLTRAGPVLVTADDLEQLDPSVLDALGRLEGPVLVVWSSRDDTERGSGPVGAILDHLAPIGRALRPLSRDEVRRSVQQTAGLSPAFARLLADVAEGNPGLAHRIIADLVARSALRLSPGGWSADAEAVLAIPQSTQDGWDLHLDRLADRAGTDGLIAFGIASAIGRRVEVQLWTRVVKSLDLDVDTNLLEALADLGLLQTGPAHRTAEFVHPVLRQRALVRCPLDRRTIHAAIADIQRQSAADPGAITEQLVFAERPEEALAPLFVAMESALQGMGTIELSRLERLGEQCFQQLDLPETDARLHRFRVLRGRAAIHFQAFRDALEHVRPVVERYGIETTLGASARLVRLMSAQGTMSLPLILEHGPPLLDVFPAGSPDHLKTRLVIGTAASFAGDGETARLWLEPAIDPRSTSLLQGRVRVQLAIAHKALDNPGHALAHIDAAVSIFERHADRRWLGQALNERGDLHRRRGDLDRALDDYSRAGELFGVLATPLALAPRINVALVALARSDYDHAETALRLAYGSALKLGLRGYAYAATHGLLASTAGRGDRLAFDESIDQLTSLAPAAHFADLDLADCAERAGRLWLARSDFGRAKKALLHARKGWQELRQGDRTAEVEALLSEIS